MIEPSVRSLRFLKRRFSCEGMSAVPAITGNILLITMFSVNASSLICWKALNAFLEKRDGERDGVGCAILLLISAQLLGFGARLFICMPWSMRCCSKIGL